MMPDALSNPLPADVASKNGSRSAKGADGSSDFSGTLSKLDKDSTTGSQTRDGLDSQADSPETDNEVDTRGHTRTSRPTFALRDYPVEIGASGLKRISIAQVFPGSKEPAAPASMEKKTRSAEDKIAESDAKDTGQDADVELVQSGEAITADTDLDASDLLNMLSNSSPQISNMAAVSGGRGAMTVEGRKSETGQGRAREASAVEAMRVNSKGPDMLDMPTTEIHPEQQERLFSFVGGKDSSLNSELSQAANGGRDRSAEAKPTAATVAAENVTVVDSRRYLGLAPTTNSANLLASMVSDSDWSAAMQSSSLHFEPTSNASTGSVVHMLKLQMNPHALGSVTATLRLIGEELHVHLTVETRAAHRQLSEDSSGMLDALKSQGFSVDQVTINIASSSDANTQKGQQDAQNGQQMAGDGERNGTAANKEQSNGRFGAELSGDADAGGDTGSSEAAVAGSIRSSSGQLYL